MESTAYDITLLIENESVLGLVRGANLFAAVMPDQPDDAVQVSDTFGRAPEANYVYDRPGFQVLIRSGRNNYRAGYQTGESIKRLLHGLTNVEVDDTRYVMILADGDFMYVGQDETGRHLLSINFTAHRTG